MEAPERDLSKLTAAQKKLLIEYERRIKDATEAIQKEAPEHVQALGGIIRKSLENGSMVEFRAFLEEHDVDIPACDLEAYRDHLIIHRIDLKDLEPAARDRMFMRAHAKEDSSNASPDYLAEVGRDRVPRCRDCQWFVTAPCDSDDNAEKSCVEMGTKGGDIACYGFTLPSN